MAIPEERVRAAESAESNEACKEVRATAFPSSIIAENSALESGGISSLNFNTESHELKLYLLWRTVCWLVILSCSCVNLPAEKVHPFRLFGFRGQPLLPVSLSD